MREAAEIDPTPATRLESRRKLEREQRRVDSRQDLRALAEARREIRRINRARRRGTAGAPPAE